MNALQGKIHGRRTELTENPGFPQGQDVEVHLRAIPEKETWGAGLRRCAGALANEWTAEDDRILDEISQERKRDSRI